MNSVLDMFKCPNVYYYKNLGYQKKLYTSTGEKPEENSEILVTGIPEKATVYDLALFFEQIGKLFDVKLISTLNGTENKGFGYVRYFSKALAQKAQKTLSNKPFKGVLLSLHTTVENCRIFLWGIPLDKSKNEVWEALIDTYGINNIVDVLVRKSCLDSSKNRGFAILKFATHEEAVCFKFNYGSNLNLFDQKLIVDWALPVKENFTSKADQIRSEVSTILITSFICYIQTVYLSIVSSPYFCLIFLKLRIPF